MEKYRREGRRMGGKRRERIWQGERRGEREDGERDRQRLKREGREIKGRIRDHIQPLDVH